MLTIQASWMAFDDTAHLQPIHNKPGYHRRVALMNSLLDVVVDDEDHALSGLLEGVGDLVSRHAREHDPIASASGHHLAPHHALSDAACGMAAHNSHRLDIKSASSHYSAIASSYQ